MNLTAVQQLLRKVPQAFEKPSLRLQQLERGVVGGALGAGAGYLASDDDDYSPVAYGAGLGAVLGAATTHQLPAQLKSQNPWVLGQLDASGAPVKDPTPTAALKTRILEKLSYDKQRLQDIPGIRQSTMDIIDTSTGGGLGQVEDYLAEPTRLIREVKKQQLGGALDEYMRLNLGLRGWEHLQARQRDYVTKAYEARLRGDDVEFDKIAQSYRELQKVLNENKVTFDDATVAQLRDYQAQQRAALGDERYGMVAQAADSLYDVFGRVRQQLKDEGLIDQTTLDKWAAEHAVTPYSPGQRSLAEEAPDGSWSIISQVDGLRRELGRRGISVKSLDNIIKRLEGSESPYRDPISSALFQIQESVSSIHRNKAAKAFITNARELVDENNVVPGSGGFYIRPLDDTGIVRPDEGVISFFENGVRQNYVVPGEYADVLNVASADDVSRGMRVLSRMQRWVSSAITGSNIAFTAANVPKDILEAMVYTPVWKHPLTFGKMWMRAMREIYEEDFRHGGQGALRQQARQAGIGHATYTRNLQEMPAYEALMSDDLSAGAKTLQWFQKALNASEEATKTATFGTLKAMQGETGMTDLDISAMARRYGGSPDFARRGTLARDIGALYQFFNPVIQGLSRFYEKGAQDPAWLMKSMGALSMGLFAVDQLNEQLGPKDPETGRSLIEAIDPQIRATNIIIMTGDTEVNAQGHTVPQYVRIPLGHVGVALLGPMQEALRLMREEPSAPSAGQVVADVVSPLLPISGTIDAQKPVSSTLRTMLASVNPIPRYLIEQGLNQTSFNDVPIVGRRLEKLEPGAQFTDTTSPTMIKAAHLIGTIPGLKELTWLTSPQRLEHGYRTFFPGALEFPLSALDARDPKVAQGEYESAARAPLFGPLVRRFLPTGQDPQRDVLAERFYGFLSDAEDAAATFRAQETPEEQAAYLEANRGKILGNQALAPVVRMIGQLGQMRRQILADPTLTPEDRKARLQALYQQQVQLLRQGTTFIQSLEGDS